MKVSNKFNEQALLRPNAARLPRSGFTLIEMLVVIGIIALLLVVAAPSMFKGVQATKLSGAGERMLGALSEAQQTAYSRNHPVEMRFYKYNGLFPDSQAFRAYQFFKVAWDDKDKKESLVKISECTKLPDGLMISPAAGLSPILSTGEVLDPPNSAGVTNCGVAGATYIAIRFMTDGNCRKVGITSQGLATLTTPLPPQFFLTLLEDDGKTYSDTAPPKNFFTIQTDPWTGKSRSYRPGF